MRRCRVPTSNRKTRSICLAGSPYSIIGYYLRSYYLSFFLSFIPAAIPVPIKPAVVAIFPTLPVLLAIFASLLDIKVFLRALTPDL